MAKLYVFKIDIDIKLNEEEYRLWKLTRIAIIESLAIRFVFMLKHDSSCRGHHIFIHCESDGSISDERLNFIQFLLGDDQTRYKINKGRLERGTSWEKANILFSRVLEKRLYDKRKQ